MRIFCVLVGLLILLAACAPIEPGLSDTERLLKQGGILEQMPGQRQLVAKDLDELMQEVFPGKAVSDLKEEFTVLAKSVSLSDGTKKVILFCEEYPCNFHITLEEFDKPGIELPEACQNLKDFPLKEITYGEIGKMYFEVKNGSIEINYYPQGIQDKTSLLLTQDGKMLKHRTYSGHFSRTYWYHPLINTEEYNDVLGFCLSKLDEWIANTPDYNPDWKPELIQIRDCIAAI